MIGNIHRKYGFTLIEILVVMVVIATLLTIAVPRYVRSVDDAKEAVLKSNLSQIREAIDHFHADLGSYPESLTDLVDKNYIRSVPVDPITESSRTWELVAPPGGKEPSQIFDVRSGASGSSRSGESYANW